MPHPPHNFTSPSPYGQRTSSADDATAAAAAALAMQNQHLWDHGAAAAHHAHARAAAFGLLPPSAAAVAGVSPFDVAASLLNANVPYSHLHALNGGGHQSINSMLPPHPSQQQQQQQQQQQHMMESSSPAAAIMPRGKPESMAARLASAALAQQKMDELEAEADEVEADVVAEPVDDSMADIFDPNSNNEPRVTVVPESTAAATPKKKKKKASPAPKKKSPTVHPTIPSMDDPVPEITPPQYQALETLMTEFCKVPLLAEFSRPVSLLHPELMSAYSKIVSSPIDLGKVCRDIRRRRYNDLRSIRLDMWRIFANCVRYHSHPSNKEAVPSFVSIALHLRDHFNALWQEHVLPSNPLEFIEQRGPQESQLQIALDKRAQDRKKRLTVAGLTLMTANCMERAANALERFLSSGGRADFLDISGVLEGPVLQNEEVQIVIENIQRVIERLREQPNGAEYGSSSGEYVLDEFNNDVKRCYTENILENDPTIRMRIGQVLDRVLGKIVVPIYEANCRGVPQSSVWGCMAAAVWARESSKKPFWPALVLGIMAPDDQREDWHAALTERNESRLPEKLRAQLMGGKRKAEQAIKRQSMGQLDPHSYFLVEFLGTHEFIWVRESDMVENFDPAEDPNTQTSASGNKKKRNSRSNNAAVLGSKTYASAIEEGKWALEEFEMQLQDMCGDVLPEEDNEDGEEMNYSYNLLCQSDDEADEEIDQRAKATPSTATEIDEYNELLATDGLLDFSPSGRKNAKRRAQALKKQKADAEKKNKADKTKKVKAEVPKKKETTKPKERDLEKRRKKRVREREKMLKDATPNLKKSRLHDSSALKKGGPGVCKRTRATSVVKAYLMRTSKKHDYKTLALGGVLTIPTATVDSSGLLGMSLAFRTAAGELDMPDDNGRNEPRLKPWEAIKVDSKRTTLERTACLEKQIALLKEEISDVCAATARRRELLNIALRDVAVSETDLMNQEASSRQNPYKVKKKSATPKNTPDKSKALKTMGLEANGNSEFHSGSKDYEESDSVARSLGDDPEFSTQPPSSRGDPVGAHADAEVVGWTN